MTSSGDWVRLYVNVSLIDCETAEAMDDLLSNTTLGRFVVSRLSECAVLIDGQQKTSVTRALSRRGQLFRVVDLPPFSPVPPSFGAGR